MSNDKGKSYAYNPTFEIVLKVEHVVTVLDTESKTEQVISLTEIAHPKIKDWTLVYKGCSEAISEQMPALLEALFRSNLAKEL